MSSGKQQLLNRLKTIEGHVRGVQRMLADDAHCTDILKQTQAIQRALETFNMLILTEHLHGCVIAAIRSEDTLERERMVHELLELFETSSKL